jgi:hypothetical protein
MTPSGKRWWIRLRGEGGRSMRSSGSRSDGRMDQQHGVPSPAVMIDEVRDPGERHEGRNWARRGSRPFRQRAGRRLSTAFRIASRPGPVGLSAQRISSAACSGTVPWRLTRIIHEFVR